MTSQEFEEKYMRPLASLGAAALFVISALAVTVVVVIVLDHYFVSMVCLSSIAIGFLLGLGAAARVARIERGYSDS